MSACGPFHLLASSEGYFCSWSSTGRLLHHPGLSSAAQPIKHFFQLFSPTTLCSQHCTFHFLKLASLLISWFVYCLSRSPWTMISMRARAFSGVFLQLLHCLLGSQNYLLKDGSHYKNFKLFQTQNGKGKLCNKRNRYWSDRLYQNKIFFSNFWWLQAYNMQERKAWDIL